MQKSARQCERLKKICKNISNVRPIASGAEPRVGKPERPRDEMDALDTHSCTQSIASRSNILENVSVTSIALNLPARGADHACVSQKGSKVNWTRQTHAHTHRALQTSLRGLKINLNTSENLKMASQCQTHLVQAQNCAKRSHRGPETMRMHQAHARTHSALELTWKWLQEQAKTSGRPKQAKTAQLTYWHGELVQR